MVEKGPRPPQKHQDAGSLLKPMRELLPSLQMGAGVALGVAVVLAELEDGLSVVMSVDCAVVLPLEREEAVLERRVELSVAVVLPAEVLAGKEADELEVLEDEETLEEEDTLVPLAAPPPCFE